MPNRVAAAHYGTFSTVAYAGRHPDTDEFWQCHDSGFGGWGALCDMDGPGPFRTMCHGDTRLIPVELHEATYPFMIESFGLRADSGGAGEYRGGLGLDRRYLMLAPCRISTRIERTLCPAWGMNGGAPGASGTALIERTDGTTQAALKDVVMLKVGDRVRIQTGEAGATAIQNTATVTGSARTYTAATFRRMLHVRPTGSKKQANQRRLCPLSKIPKCATASFGSPPINRLNGAKGASIRSLKFVRSRSSAAASVIGCRNSHHLERVLLGPSLRMSAATSAL